MNVGKWGLMLGMMMVVSSGAKAEEGTATPTPTPAPDLEKKVEILAKEVERLKAGEEVFAEATESQFGFGPAASKVYRTKKGVSIGGYGEFVFQNFDSENESGAASGAQDTIDMLRAVLYTGYKFN